MATILILDGLQRKSLAATRFLSMGGHRVLTAEVTYFSICRFSRHASRSLVYPSPVTAPDAFYRWLQDVLVRESIDVVIPADDVTTEIIARHTEDLSAMTHVLVPPYASFMTMREKALSAEWFHQAGVTHPRTISIRDLAQVRPAALELGLPLVIKARESSGSRGLRFVAKLNDVEATYQAVHREHPWPVMQQYITPGPKYHVCLLYNRAGQPVVRYVQRELRQYPITGGPSTLQQWVDRPDLLALVERTFARLPWTGPLQADVMEDGKTGISYVIEVNPRYWQSLNLAQWAGVPFVSTHVALALGQPIPTPPQVNPPTHPLRGRSLLPFDMLAYLSDPNRRHWDPPFFRPGPQTHDDLLSWSDPGPTLGFFLAVGRYLFSPSMWRAVLRREPDRDS